jgi:hypothetical protein
VEKEEKKIYEANIIIITIIIIKLQVKSRIRIGRRDGLQLVARNKKGHPQYRKFPIENTVIANPSAHDKGAGDGESGCS